MRGYGHVKLANVALARAREAELLHRFDPAALSAAGGDDGGGADPRHPGDGGIALTRGQRTAPRSSHTLLCEPIFMALLTTAISPSARTASLFISRPWVLPLNPPAGSTLPAIGCGALNCTPSADTAMASP